MSVRIRRTALPICLTSALLLTACGTPKIAYDNPTPALLAAGPPSPVEIVEIAKPLPLPGQLKPVAEEKPQVPVKPTVRVERANEAARMEPARDGFINAVQVYPFSSGALYQVYAAPGQVTDIALQPGEKLVGSGPVAAGDTVRWIIGDTVSGKDEATQVHIFVKPTRPDLTTNLIINTDRRTYHLELHARPKTYLASVSWTYPEDQLIAIRGRNAEAVISAPVDTSLDLASLNFRYRIEGDRPPWRPLRAFDDSRKVYIEFPAGIGQGEMPPLFVVGAKGGAELVNYRVRGRHIIVDRLFEAAELRLGDRQKVVRIERTDGRLW